MPSPIPTPNQASQRSDSRSQWVPSGDMKEKGVEGIQSLAVITSMQEDDPDNGE